MPTSQMSQLEAVIAAMGNAKKPIIYSGGEQDVNVGGMLFLQRLQTHTLALTCLYVCARAHTHTHKIALTR